MSGVVSGLPAAVVRFGEGVADDLQVDAEGREIGLEHLRRLRRLLQLLQDVDLDRPLHRRALGDGLLVELLGLLQVVVVARGILREAPDRVGQRRRVALRRCLSGSRR